MKDSIVGRWHLLPEDPERAHEHTSECWCGPEEDELEPGLWIHNDTNEGPDYPPPRMH